MIRHFCLVVSAPALDGTGCEFDSWQCSWSLRLIGSLRVSLGTYGLTKNCVKNIHSANAYTYYHLKHVQRMVQEFSTFLNQPKCMGWIKFRVLSDALLIINKISTWVRGLKDFNKQGLRQDAKTRGLASRGWQREQSKNS